MDASGPRTRIIALMNQKGGVGKTTTTVNLGAALAEMGHRVLLVDLDPQAHLSLHLGVDPQLVDATVYDLLTDADLSVEAVLQHPAQRISVIPSEVNLAGAETELAPQMVTGRAQRVLMQKIKPLLDGPAGASSPAHYDYVLIDCPPSLGLLTINALILAREVLVPMQAHFLALQGLSKLLETVGLIRQSFNPQLAVSGVVLCMHEGQTILATEVVNDLRNFLESARGTDVPWKDAVVFDPPVRRNIKLAESPSFGKSIFDYARGSHGAVDYRQIAEALAKHKVIV